MALFDRFRRPPAPLPTTALPSSGPRALTAAASKVDLDSKTGGRAVHANGWSADAWTYRRAIGEVKDALDWRANVLSRIRLHIAVVIDPAQAPVDVKDATEPPVGADGLATGDPAEVTDLPEQMVTDAIGLLDRLAGGGIGHAAILKPLTTNWDVAGECYLIGRADPADAGPDPQTVWQIRSMDELSRNADGRWILTSAPSKGTASATGEVLNPETTYVARLWTPDPRFREMPDSPMAGILDSCEAILLKSRKGRARDRARLSRGVLLVAAELETKGPDGRPTSFEIALQTSMLAAVQDESSVGSLVPTVVTIPAQRIADGTAMQHIDVIDKDDQTRDDEQIAGLLARAIRGLPLPPEVAEGMGRNTFANGVVIDSMGFRYYLEPTVQAQCDALTQAYLWVGLDSLGWDPEQARRLVVWFNPSEVVSNPNRLPDALQLHEALAISDEALRDAGGFDPSDAPSEEELARRVDQKRPRSQQGAPGGTVDGEVVEALPSGETQQPALVASLTDRRPHPFSDRTLALDLDLRGRVEAACDAAMRRALERAGARTISKIGKDTGLRSRTTGLATGQVTAFLGREQVRALGLSDEALLDGAFGDVAERFTEWAAATFEQALEAACALTGQPYYGPDAPESLTAAVPDLLPPFSDLPAGAPGGIDQIAARARFLTDLAAAAEGLARDLEQTAKDRLYTPPTVPGQGEYDPNLTVSPATVRTALARAGGADTSLTFSGLTDRGQPANPSDGDPGLLATGLNLTESLVLAGVKQYAYRWTWGGSPRPFLPHKQLDGQVFEDQTDAALSVGSYSWLPYTSFAPGDHDGCRCSTSRLYEDPFAGLSTSDARRVRAAQQTRDARGRLGPSAVGN